MDQLKINCGQSQTAWNFSPDYKTLGRKSLAPSDGGLQPQYISDVTGSPTVKSVTCGCFVDNIRWGFVMGIRTNIHGPAAFPVLLLIHIEKPHHY